MGRLEDGLAQVAAAVSRLQQALEARQVVAPTAPARTRKPASDGAQASPGATAPDPTAGPAPTAGRVQARKAGR
jgi:hypothetical protein